MSGATVSSVRSGAVIVTGGAGFIGSHVVDALVHEGFRVRVIDCLHPLAHSGTPGYLNREAEYVFADLRDPAAIDSALDGATAVSHQASMVGLGADFADVTDYADHNCVGTATLLQALHNRRFRGRLVLGSSMVIYGEGRYRCPVHGIVRPPPRDHPALTDGRFDPTCPECGKPLAAEPVTEDSPPDPRSVYAATKLLQENLCFAFGHAAEIPVVALRYHNVYGPRMPRQTPYAGVASIFRSALAAGDAPQVFEDGRQMRDFVHVSDVARANLLALTIEPPVSGAFNIASGEPHTVGELARALVNIFDSAVAPKIGGPSRPGDVRHVFASIDRARRQLGFRPQVSFAEGVRRFAHEPLREAAGIRARESRG